MTERQKLLLALGHFAEAAHRLACGFEELIELIEDLEDDRTETDDTE